MNIRMRRTAGTLSALALMVAGVAGPSTAAVQDKPAATQDAAAAAAVRDAELRALGESYRRSGDEQQTPEGLAATQNLNATQIDQARSEAEADARRQAEYEAAQARYRDQIAANERAEAEAQTRHQAELQAYERQRSAYEAALAESQRAEAAYQAALAACRVASPPCR